MTFRTLASIDMMAHDIAHHKKSMVNAKLFLPFSDLAAALLPVPSATDGAHDTSHLARVWRNARAIQLEEGGDLEILAAAVLLHDCVTVAKDSPLRSQASRLAAREATSQLKQLGWSDERIAQVATAIESHSYSAGIATTTLEACILQDADRLDAIGFTGIARCLYTAGRMGSSLYEVSDPRAKHRTLNDADYALDHFPAKLLCLADGFKTATGRLLAARRHEAVRYFYDGMLDEVDNP
jgi:uncharacterized protein